MLSSVCVTHNERLVQDGAIDGSGTAIAMPKVPLSTQSRYIVDTDGKRFKLAGVNWYGAESAMLVPDGLAMQPMAAIAKQTRDMGFNSVRIPFCNQLVEQNPVVADSLVTANPELRGKTSLEVLDAVIDALSAQGLVTILDNHRSRGDWCCDTIHGDGLWYTAEYPETAFISDWETMARRYKDKPLVIGADLRNELRPQLAPGVPTTCTDCNVPTADCVCENASWGTATGINRDWTPVAEKTGNAILAVRPDWLIFVEGPDWASWLGAMYRPLVLSVPNRLVYSAHKYASSDFTGDCEAYKTKLDGNFGFVVNPGMPYTAPLWLGEFGIGHNDTANAWWSCMREYMAAKDFDWAYWPLNGTQGPGYNRVAGKEESFGVLNMTWDAPANPAHLSQLQALQAASPTGGSGGTGGTAGGSTGTAGCDTTNGTYTEATTFATATKTTPYTMNAYSFPTTTATSLTQTTTGPAGLDCSAGCAMMTLSYDAGIAQYGAGAQFVQFFGATATDVKNLLNETVTMKIAVTLTPATGATAALPATVGMFAQDTFATTTYTDNIWTYDLGTPASLDAASGWHTFTYKVIDAYVPTWAPTRWVCGSTLHDLGIVIGNNAAITATNAGTITLYVQSVTVSP
jgi:endoglucanase